MRFSVYTGFKAKLQQLAVDAWRSPERVLKADLPDQRTKVGVDLGSPSLGTRPPTPIAAKTRPMPTYQCLGTDNPERLQGRRKPSIELYKQPAIAVRETNPSR